MANGSGTTDYSISQVSLRTGLSTQLIRKWEQRYHIVSPHRLENGYRVYSERDIERLRAVQALVAVGHTVASAVRAVGTAVTKTPSSRQAPWPSVVSGGLPGGTSIGAMSVFDTVQALLDAGLVGDTLFIEKTLQHLQNVYGLEYVVTNVIPTFLRAVGDAWERGDWTEYQEHLASVSVRDFLVRTQSHVSVDGSAPLLLGACFPYERHEIPVHLILVAANLRGFRTQFLGTAPAPGAIEQAVIRLQPKRVVISASTIEPFLQDEQLLTRLDKFAKCHPACAMFIGGPGVHAVLAQRTERLHALRLTLDVADVYANPADNRHPG